MAASIRRVAQGLLKIRISLNFSCGRLRRESPAKSGPSRVVATHVSSVRSWSSHTSAKSGPSRVVATHVSSVRSWSSHTSAKSAPSRVVATHVSSVRSWSSHTSAKSAPSRVVATHVSSVRSWSSDTSQEERQKTIAAHDTNFENDPQLASGKTTVKILNQETEDGMFIDAYSCMGFRLNNGMRVMGPCAVFPRSVLHWNVKGVEDICEESLSLFTLLEPKIDILILGVGERENMHKVDPAIIKYLRIHRINIEILSTDHALATFNFLNSERRYVAGAFIPPSYVEEDRFDDLETSFSHLVESGEQPFVTKTDYDYIPGHRPPGDDVRTIIKKMSKSLLPDRKKLEETKKEPGRYEE